MARTKTIHSTVLISRGKENSIVTRKKKCVASTLKQQFASAVAFFATITSSFLCLNFCLGDEHHETYHREAHT